MTLTGTALLSALSLKKEVPMKYPLSPEALADAAKRNVRHMELDDLAAMKVCLLSTGALLGLSCKGRLSRRLMGLTCSFLAAGLAI